MSLVGDYLSVQITIVAVIVVSVISGPLIPDASATTEKTGPSVGTGTAEVKVVAAPGESITFESGDFGAETYHLDGKPAVIRVRNVQGNPAIRYAIDIPALGLTDTNTYALGRIGPGRHELRLRPFELSPKWIDRERYNATVAVWLIHRRIEHTQLYQERITIGVRE